MTVQAFDQAVRTKRRGLLEAAYRALGDWDDAEDVLQEALLAAWRYPPQEPVRNAGGLLYQHLRQRLSRWRRGRTVPITQELLAVHPAFSVPDASARVLDKDEVTRALSAARPLTRRALLLKAEGLTWPAIGVKLGVAPSTLRKRCQVWQGKVKNEP